MGGPLQGGAYKTGSTKGPPVFYAEHRRPTLKHIL
jgi:hypothetical protein